MKANEFIFSNRLLYRISRHVLFWLGCFVFLQLTYHYPGHIFPNWDIQTKTAETVEKFGVDYVTLRGGLLWMIWEISYRQGSVFLGLIAFTYGINYLVLPRLAKKKKWPLTVLLMLGLLLGFLMLTYFMVYWTMLDTNRMKAKMEISIKGPERMDILNKTSAILFLNLIIVSGLAIIIKIFKRSWITEMEAKQVARENAIAELQLLKAQIHPHFLFNSLNNIYSFALEGSSRTPEMIKKLSGLLHYMLRDCRQPLVSLEKELNMIRDYIELEKIRYGERLRINMSIEDGPGWMIAPLLLIPFVENSFKHGTSKMLSSPEISFQLFIEENTLYLELTNSHPPVVEDPPANGNRGLGLHNVTRRLKILYPGQHELLIRDEQGIFTARLRIILSESRASGPERKEKALLAETEPG